MKNTIEQKLSNFHNKYNKPKKPVSNFFIIENKINPKMGVS